MRVLVVEDERRMAALLEQALVEEGIHVFLAHDGETGVAAARSSPFDVIVLDIQLPKLDGISVARRLRSQGDQTPILMLTARDSQRDIVEALNLGADDYVTKPFSFEVLLARIHAISRRRQLPQPVCLQVADLNLNTITREVSREGKPLRLTKREHSLLELLMRNAGRPVSRDTILEAVWGFRSEVEENTVEAFIKLLRHKMDAPFPVKLLHTIRGVGYCLRVPEA
jgi:DNA-binding response OmpR family regulator